jgi:hypothetical protein
LPFAHRLREVGAAHAHTQQNVGKHKRNVRIARQHVQCFLGVGAGDNFAGH